ncbi:hypothetical protein KIL84_020924 [Mauremys mutica]|uniref:Uncharacterized protein n=1 Tax=Mauremys mutica TaxID=74926 RepID=A0A9D4B116_9SAUR|nr:hypothetical protein KIL84_020924 [Mauremys mutica]
MAPSLILWDAQVTAERGLMVGGSSPLEIPRGAGGRPVQRWPKGSTPGTDGASGRSREAPRGFSACQVGVGRRASLAPRGGWKTGRAKGALSYRHAPSPHCCRRKVGLNQSQLCCCVSDHLLLEICLDAAPGEGGGLALAQVSTTLVGSLAQEPHCSSGNVLSRAAWVEPAPKSSTSKAGASIGPRAENSPVAE